ncbi:MAG TPA: hypothetical protein PLO89_04960, partial [Spirochaetota bacterium]|nr:hypothetical protein [Spirochaetota bacterium]
GFQKAEISKYNQDELRKYEESLKIYRDLKGVVNTSFYEGEKIGIEKGEKIGIEKGEKIGIEKGEKIGIEKGKTEGKYETAKKMKQKGFDTKTISDITGLNENEIEKL